MNATVHRYGTELRCYDNGGKTADRYTLIPPRWARGQRDRCGLWPAFGCGAEPFHPQGIGQYTSAAPGSHLGKRVSWSELPPDVQRAARQVFPEYAP